MPVKRLILISVVVLAAIFFAFTRLQDNQTSTGTENTNASLIFNKSQHSLDDPNSIWVIVNKKRMLMPKDYAPTDLFAPKISLKDSANSEGMKLRRVAATALEELNTEAKKQEVNLLLISAYRSHKTQATIYDSEVRGFGREVADTESARPGYSEHQTGLAVDLAPTSRECEIEECFAQTPEGKWLAANAHKFGFVIRYGTDQQHIVGYKFEPWHLRYAGKELAAEAYKTGQTLEEFFNLPYAADYN